MLLCCLKYEKKTESENPSKKRETNAYINMCGM